MKKTVVLFALAATLPALAHAQGSVTLYGIADVGINWTSNAGGSHLISMTDGVSRANRLGFKGAEDLGDGLKAVFVLENGFTLVNGTLGQGGRMFGRQAFVGLSSDKYGSVTLGRQYDSVVDMMQQYSAFAVIPGGYLLFRPADIDNFGDSHRVNNAIKYTNTLGPVSVTGLYSLGGVAGQFSQNQIWSLGASYSGAGLGLAASYLNVRNPNTSFFSDTSSSALTGNVPSPVYSGYASAHTYEVIGLAAQYVLGSLTVGTTYSNVRFDDLGNLSSGPNALHYSGTAVFNSIDIHMGYRFTPSLSVGVAYNYTHNGGASTASASRGATYNELMGGADYLLSKRTDVYVMGVWQRASGTDSSGKPAVADIGLGAVSGSNTQSLVRIGLTHKF
ncbi:outer membrane protein (porin) [Caballeronia udeis]|uniref:Outer membrane protein (Porin) n=1 Tax=Caballeronia udeis TaxID=1232866 RepID=A0A158JJL5_9BURK|nr:porin [Caballeronia udeis]SAL68653.1 outer membrane protein (porin) [Caballeronia udeis]